MSDATSGDRFRFPVYVIVDRLTHPALGLPDSIKHLPTTEGHVLAFYRQRELGELAAETVRLTGTSVAEVPDRETFLKCLKWYEANGGTHVGFDVASTERARGFYNVRALIAASGG